MPRFFDVKSVLILGPGPVLIGQGCEFDYSSVQACLAFKNEGIRTIALSSNCATLMTDPSFCDASYVEPMTVDVVAEVIRKERPSALYASAGGQRALSLALELYEMGILQQYQVRILGPQPPTIITAESRDLFYACMLKGHLAVATHQFVQNSLELQLAMEKIPFPMLVRQSFCLGGEGSVFVASQEELTALCHSAFEEGRGLMLDTSVIGWKEFEIEVLTDVEGNAIAVCALENIDPMGVHTGDSFAVSPVLTITDTEYQAMRSMAFACTRAVGLLGGGANVQLAMDPVTREIIIVEMNARNSRSSALSSKATGYSIARVAALISLGYLLHEIDGALLAPGVLACYEPALDYVVVKAPKFQFEKFPHAEDRLSSKMHAVGEVMAIGVTFQEALSKAIKGLARPHTIDHSLQPSSSRLFALIDALQGGAPMEAVQKATGIDMWFLQQIACMKERQTDGQSPSFCSIDSTAAEKPGSAKVVYATRMRGGKELAALGDNSYIVIGSGACSIGQGIEYDTMCSLALFALRRRSLTSIMINDNPSAVSTDHTFSDRLYISPLSVQDVADICFFEKPKGVILSFGGQAAISLAEGLAERGIPLMGLEADVISLCEDRGKFRGWIEHLGLMQPRGISLYTPDEKIPAFTYPSIVRPSFVIGGCGMVIAHQEQEIRQHLKGLAKQSRAFPCVIEEFLQDAIEVDVDILSDASRVYIPALQEQIEPAGIHSGDSMHIIPPRRLSSAIQHEIMNICGKVALALGYKGIINIQLAVQNNKIYVLEVNPRAARTVPFVTKAVSKDLVDMAVGCMLGEDLMAKSDAKTKGPYFIKRPVFSSHVFEQRDHALQMQSTGEIMGWAESFESAMSKVGCNAEYVVYDVQSMQSVAAHLPKDI